MYWILFLSLAYMAGILGTLSHCLSNCPQEDKIPYTLTIILAPFGWVLYWLKTPYDMNVLSNEAMSRTPAGQELLKPQTTPPFPPPTEQIKPPAPVVSHSRPPIALPPKPTPATPIHIIHARKQTQHPFPTEK